MDLISDDALERSTVVANCRMNRERVLTGSNGYAKELAFNPLDLLRERIMSAGHARWLDMCCGSGKALLEAANFLDREGLDQQVEIVGVDLVGFFIESNSQPSCLRLVEASLSNWKAEKPFDLITCVHGLHYVGDKLGLITRASSWLTPSGRFTANLDMQNIKLQSGQSSSRIVPKELRRQGFDYDFRKKRLQIDGCRSLTLPFRYLGADDQAGPNSTGQPAVDSYYERVDV